MVKKKTRVHFVGIGGIGVSSLARYYKHLGAQITGSDNTESELTKELSKEKISISIPQSPKNLARKTDLVIHSQAIQPDHPERMAAREMQIREISYPQAIGELTRQYKTIAICGAHGKSTTTAMAALMLQEAQKDPTVIIGTKLKEFGNKNFRPGKSKILVLESDEYGRALLNYRFRYAIVTNIDKEHLDTYKNLKDIQNTFLKFFENGEPGGTLVLCKDSSPLFALKNKIQKIGQQKNLRVVWYGEKDRSADLIRAALAVPGKHNVLNALAVYNLGLALKIPESKILHALHNFSGTWRRMEKIGKFKVLDRKIEIYDDYAHHPTEIRATLQAFREKYPERLLACVFEPHQAKRLNYLFREFTGAFLAADETIILPLYRVPGRDSLKGKNAKDLVLAIKKKYPKKQVVYLNRPDNIVRVLEKLICKKANRSKDVVIAFLGAGSITKYSKQLIEELVWAKVFELFS